MVVFMHFNLQKKDPKAVLFDGGIFASGTSGSDWQSNVKANLPNREVKLQFICYRSPLFLFISCRVGMLISFMSRLERGRLLYKMMM
jgi:hypothetical protein